MKDTSVMSQGHTFRPDKGKAFQTSYLTDLAFMPVSLIALALMLSGACLKPAGRNCKLPMVSVKLEHHWPVGFQGLHPAGPV